MTIESPTAQLRALVQERGWEQFHTPNSLTMALVGEAGEVLSLFQWLRNDRIDGWFAQPANRTAVEHEVADVFGYLLSLADVLGIDMEAVLRDIISVNAAGRHHPLWQWKRIFHPRGC